MAEILTRPAITSHPPKPHFVGSGRCVRALVAILPHVLLSLRPASPPRLGRAFIVGPVLWKHRFHRSPNWVFGLAVTVTLLYQAIVAFSHTRRVKLIAERLDSTALASPASPPGGDPASPPSLRPGRGRHPRASLHGES
jgi:hypothetical protein